MTPETGQKLAYLICFVVISITVAGYFIGLQSPMNPSGRAANQGNEEIQIPVQSQRSKHDSGKHDADVISATRYEDMYAALVKRSTKSRSHLNELKSSVNPLAEVTITEGQKSFALALREQNRAFNGAPPTIPHPVEQLSTQTCMVCHENGIKSETFRVSKMSHQFLANCTQCHVEAVPQHMTPVNFRENLFVGMPAPTGGARAYPGAPPTIPHSTWMRVDCMSCHGPTGLHGIRTTHPWRQNCQQCHAPSSKLDQVQLDTTPQFLPPPKIVK